MSRDMEGLEREMTAGGESRDLGRSKIESSSPPLSGWSAGALLAVGGGRRPPGRRLPLSDGVTEGGRRRNRSRGLLCGDVIGH